MKIRQILFVAIFGLATSFAAQAQRIAYVDVNAILETMPAYKTAQTELDRLSEQWKQEIARDYQAIEEMYRKYQAEEVLLSSDARKQREDEIVEKEKQVREKQKQKFGSDGELFKKRQSLVKPMQDKVYKAITDYAKEKGFDFIFDKATAGMLFANDTFDKTQDISKRLAQ
jgi:outer membrane protein